MECSNQGIRVPFGLGQLANVSDCEQAVECHENLHVSWAELEYGLDVVLKIDAPDDVGTAVVVDALSAVEGEWKGLGREEDKVINWLDEQELEYVAIGFVLVLLDYDLEADEGANKVQQCSEHWQGW